jgi:molybdopterin synthase catalytic subunit
MDESPFRVTGDPLDPQGVVRVVSGADASRHGAVTSFLGTVRDENLGRRVERLEYEAYEPLAVKAFEIIGREIQDRWPSVRLAIHHRTGRLAIGEISVAIAAASAHRADAFAACRYAIERVKQIAPIWKHEFFEGGDVWIEGATADPADAGAREAAYRTACA